MPRSRHSAPTPPRAMSGASAGRANVEIYLRVKPTPRASPNMSLDEVRPARAPRRRARPPRDPSPEETNQRRRPSTAPHHTSPVRSLSPRADPRLTSYLRPPSVLASCDARRARTCATSTSRGTTPPGTSTISARSTRSASTASWAPTRSRTRCSSGARRARSSARSTASTARSSRTARPGAGRPSPSRAAPSDTSTAASSRAPCSASTRRSPRGTTRNTPSTSPTSRCTWTTATTSSATRPRPPRTVYTVRRRECLSRVLRLP